MADNTHLLLKTVEQIRDDFRDERDASRQAAPPFISVWTLWPMTSALKTTFAFLGKLVRGKLQEGRELVEDANLDPAHRLSAMNNLAQWGAAFGAG